MIGDAFVWASRHDRTFTDGRLRSAYQAGDVDLPPGWLPHDRPGTARVPGFYNEAPDFHLSPGEIIDLPALARQLLAGDGPDLKRIRPGLSDETVKMLAKYAVYPATVLPDCSCWSLNKPKMSSAENLKPLIRDLNLLIDKSIVRPPDAPAKGAPALQLSQRLAWARDNRAALDKLFPQELLASQSFIEVRQEAIDSGDNAWTMIALLALYQASHDAQYLETAKRIGEFLGKFKDGSEGYQGFLGGIDSRKRNLLQRRSPKMGLLKMSLARMTNVRVPGPAQNITLTYMPHSQECFRSPQMIAGVTAQGTPAGSWKPCGTVILKTKNNKAASWPARSTPGRAILL